MCVRILSPGDLPAEMACAGSLPLLADSLSLQLSASSKISLRTNCGELRTECKTRLGDGSDDRPLLLGDKTLGEEPGDEGVVDGDVGEMEAVGVARPDPVIPLRWPVTGDVNGDVRGLRKPNPMLDVVGKGAGTSMY